MNKTLEAKCAELAGMLKAQFPNEVVSPESNHPAKSLYLELRKTLYQIRNAPELFGKD